MNYDEMNKKERNPAEDVRNKSGNETLYENVKEVRREAPTMSVVRKMKRETRKLDR